MYDIIDIERACSRTLAGLKSLVLIDPNDLVTQPRWNVVPTVAELAFKPGKSAHILKFSLHTARLSDDTDVDQAAGDFFTYRLEAFVRVIRIEIDFLRSLLRHRRIHVVATYKDGSQRFVPYMRLKAKGDSGIRPAGELAGYSFTGVSTLQQPAPYVGGEIDMPGTGTGSTVHTVTTTDSTYTYEVPADALLLAIDVKGDTYQEVSIGLTAGGEQLGGPTPIEADESVTFDVTRRIHTPTTIHFSGLDGTNEIEIWYNEL